MNTASSSKMKMTSGILQLVWAELKTMNMAKIKSIYKIAVGYVGMKFFARKKPSRSEKAIQQKEFQETAYRLSS